MNPKAAVLKLLARRSYDSEFRPETFKKILIVRPAKIGDTICLLPLIRELNRALPSAQIDIYASTYNNFMFQHVPQVHKVYTKYRKNNLIKTLFDIFRMRAIHYDLVIDTMEIRFGKIIALLFINPKWIIGNNGHTDRYGIRHSDLGFYYKLTTWKQIHMSDMLLEFLVPLGITAYDNTMYFPVGEDAMENARSIIEPFTERTLVGLNADASSTDRSLRNDEICAICRNLTEHDSNITIVLFCSPERRRYMQNLIDERRLANTVCERGTRNIFDASALASLMQVIISPDTSFVHIASAFNVPTVAIFQNDEAHLKYWSPRSERNVVIQPEHHGSTIRGFSVDDTVAAALSLLQGNS